MPAQPKQDLLAILFIMSPTHCLCIHPSSLSKQILYPIILCFLPQGYDFLKPLLGPVQIF